MFLVAFTLWIEVNPWSLSERGRWRDPLVQLAADTATRLVTQHLHVRDCSQLPGAQAFAAGQKGRTTICKWYVALPKTLIFKN